MRRIALVATLLLAIIASSCTTAGSAAAKPPEIRGTITQIEARQGGDVLGTIRVEGVRELDTEYDKASIAIMADAPIHMQQGQSRVKAAFADLEVGQTVEAWFTGPVRESYPVQATAAEIVILAAAPAQSTDAPAQTPQPASAEATGQVVDAGNRFGFRLFAELLKQDAGKNLFVSPASVATALAMTYNGAQGETQAAMAQALELQGMSLEDVNRAHASLLAQLANPDPKVQLSIANSLWAKEGVPFRPAFMQANRTYYGAEVTNLAFGPGTIDAINHWVEQKTNGRIERIVERLDPQSILFLVNAIYFKGAWEEPFNSEATKPGTFNLPDGRQLTLPMMRRGGYFQYLRGDGFQATSLPYGGGRVSLYIFLPDEGTSLAEFCSGLSAERWAQWMGEFGQEQGSIVLPRFQAEYKAELVDALTAMGMGIAFDSQRADLHAMVDTTMPVWIGGVTHKTFLAVTEEGTEAAGATVVEMRAGSAKPANPFSMVVDRPFFCAIRDNETGAMLFMGAIVEPSQ